MGFLQDNVWNYVFRYAYPVSFAGAVFYGVLAVTQTDISKIISNPNWVTVFNIVIGLSGLMAFSVWYNTDLSSVNYVTSLIDLDVQATKTKVLVA